MTFTWPQICIWTHLKLDESMARRHLKSPRSLSGRFLHLTLVTKWSRSWSWITYSHPPCSMWIGPPILRYSYFKIWPSKSLVKAIRVVKGQGHIWLWKFKGQGYGQGQTYWSHLRPGVQSICLLFISWQSDHFGLRYSKFHIWYKRTAEVYSTEHKRAVYGAARPQMMRWGIKFEDLSPAHCDAICHYRYYTRLLRVNKTAASTCYCDDRKS